MPLYTSFIYYQKEKFSKGQINLFRFICHILFVLNTLSVVTLSWFFLTTCEQFQTTSFKPEVVLIPLYRFPVFLPRYLLFPKMKETSDSLPVVADSSLQSMRGRHDLFSELKE